MGYSPGFGDRLKNRTLHEILEKGVKGKEMQGDGKGMNRDFRVGSHVPCNVFDRSPVPAISGIL
jgi:hypothetical protein